MKKKTRKMLAMVCSMMLVAIMAIGGTYAYLTSTTEVVTNTFTVGQVKITLDEADVDDSDNDGNTTERDYTNSYKMLPGQSYAKDPTVHIDPTSEEAYLRLKVAVTNAAAADKLFGEDTAASIFTGLDLSKWNVSSTVANDVRTYVFEYRQTIKGGDDDIALFTGITVPASFTNEEIATLNNTTMTITAEAIQVAGFEGDSAAAWAAFDETITAA